jgi:hypothetical protein
MTDEQEVVETTEEETETPEVAVEETSEEVAA